MHPRLSRLVLMAAVFALGCLPTWAAESPQWSNYGPAERHFDSDYLMFVENAGGSWLAWILPRKMSWTPGEWGSHDHHFARRGDVLEFFSGESIEGILRVDETGHTRRSFHTGDGVLHVPARIGERNAVSVPLLRERQLRDLLFTGDFRLLPGDFEGCATDLDVVDKIDEEDDGALWTRLILDYSAPTAECPHGRWNSRVWTVLDLHDGTFLAAMESKVVRLSFSDLSPVGVDATVHIVDADTAVEILSAGGDMHQLLSRALLDQH